MGGGPQDRQFSPTVTVSWLQMPKWNASPCCQSLLLGNEDAAVLVGGLISFMGLLRGFSPLPTSITLACVRANNASEVCNLEVFGELLDQQRVTFPKGKFTDSQCLWSECPLAVVTSPQVLIQKPWEGPLSTGAADCLSKTTEEMMTSSNLLYSYIKTTSKNNCFFIFIISTWIKTTSLKL